MAKQEATSQEVSLPAPAARTGPDGLAEHSVSGHVDLPGLRARISVASAAHSGEAWRTRSYLHQAPVATPNVAPYGLHRPAGLTVDPVRFFLTMPFFDCGWALFGNRVAGKRPREGHSVY